MEDLTEAEAMEVLIADDANVIRRLVRKSLMSFELDSLEIDEAETGGQAIEFVEFKSYDLIILDWNMPECYGIDVLKAAREAGQICPIIMQTANNLKSHIMDAVRAGVTDYVLKPYNCETLSEKLSQYVAHPCVDTAG